MAATVRRGGRTGVPEASTKAPSRGCVAKLKVLADTTRLQALHELVGGSRTVGDLQRALGVDQSLLSHHLAKLRDAALVVAERSGRTIRYRLADGVAAGGSTPGIDLGCCRLSFMEKAARLWIVATAMLGLLALGACGGGTAQRKLALSGSSTIAPLAAELGKAFERLHPDVRVEVQAGGSSRGVADALSGVVDLGMASRALKPEEVAQGLTGSTIALDGLCMIVHADNPVGELSAAQIVSIYRGEIRDWSAVGGAAGPITVVNKAEGRSTLELFLAHFKLKAEEVRADVVIGDNAQGLKTVAGNARAIGYVSIGSAEVEREHGSPVKLLPLGGVAAGRGTVLDGTFPLQRPLNFVTRGAPVGLAAEFVAFARTPGACALVAAQSFVPLDATQ